jgi:hypothetical protein
MHRTLDTKPVPEKVLYLNEPDLADATINYYGSGKQEEESQADHVRVYVPLDLSADAILRRLWFLVCRYKEANEQNEFEFSVDVGVLVSQIEIYDQLWFVREGKFDTDENGMICGHSRHAADVIKDFISKLETVDICEDFPYDMIGELKREYEL